MCSINDLMTYLKTIRAKVVIFGIKPKLMKCTCTFELTIRAKVESCLVSNRSL
jgi:hypothetical protein